MQQVKELRDRTQAGLNDCRSALVEADGDMDKAIEIILKKGLAKSAKRAGAVATEGLVLTSITADGKSGVIVEVNIQTDFAARNEEFVQFAHKVLEVAKQAEAGADLGTAAMPGGSGTVDEARQALVGKLGENITIRRWERVAVKDSGRVQSYVHMGGKIGVLLAVSVGTDAAAKSVELGKLADDVAMQVAAMNPPFLSADEVPQAEKDKQAEIFDAQLTAEGKPEKVRPKIVEGKIAKWLKEVCLLEQQSVLETEKTVDQLRSELAKQLGTDVGFVRYARFQVGEGIEKVQKDDFASEVAKMAGG
jgi:elongation factor Ts